MTFRYVTGFDYPDTKNGVSKYLINRLPINTATFHSYTVTPLDNSHSFKELVKVLNEQVSRNMTSTSIVATITFKWVSIQQVRYITKRMLLLLTIYILFDVIFISWKFQYTFKFIIYNSKLYLRLQLSLRLNYLFHKYHLLKIFEQIQLHSNQIYLLILYQLN